MRIVAVGEAAREALPDLEEGAPARDDAEARAEPAAPGTAREEELEEIAADEVATLVGGEAAASAGAAAATDAVAADAVATDAAETSAAADADLGTDIPIDVEETETISIPPPDVEPEPAPPTATPASAREAEGVKPPPPPQRKPKAGPSLPKPAPQTKRRQKAPWWEEVFGEDFVRASLRLTDDQVRREVDFIEESLGVATGGVVLDLGCGPGHHAVELTSRGYGVVGYDLSLYQLALASDVAHERGQKLNFLQGDMREMAFDEMFDGIFCWNTTFGYFEEEKNVHVAERVFRALRPGGMFLIDVVNRDYVAASSPCQLWYEGDSCVCMDDMSLDFITSRMRVKRSVILDDGRTREVVYSVRVYSLHELGKLLHDVGFRVTEASGHPSTPGVFFGQHSPRIIMLAQKP